MLLDIDAARAAAASAGKVGVVGYCLGGSLAWLAATRLHGVAAASCYYGGRIVGIAGEKPRCPVQMHFGDKDQSIPIADVEKIRENVPARLVEIFVYPAGHAFNRDGGAELRAAIGEACARAHADALPGARRLTLAAGPDRGERRRARHAGQPQSALPGKRRPLARIAAAALNSVARACARACFTEAAIKQEVALAAVLLPVSFFVASNVWVWLALVASVLFVLVVEFLNTAVERLCNHVTPERHEAIRVTKDLASTAVFFALFLAGLVWLVALVDRFGLIG